MAEEAEARVAVWEYAHGFYTMRIVKCVIELGLPDVLEKHGRAMTLSELSLAVDCPETSLYRIMRFLTHRGIFKKQIGPIRSEAEYGQTPLSHLLTREKMGTYVLVQAGPPGLWEFDISAQDLRAGKGSGRGKAAPDEDAMWHMELDEAEEKLCQEFFVRHGRLTTATLIDNSPETFQGIASLVDVGGNIGTSLAMLVKAFPWLRGINFDMPKVVARAPSVDGVHHVGGSMFDSVPKADAVMLMWVLHDWSDQLCVEILKKCKEAVPVDTGRVIIVEAVIDEEEGDEYTGARLALDMTMMCSTVNAKERTATEWAHLLNTVGFSSHTIKNMKAIESVIVAYP